MCIICNCPDNAPDKFLDSFRLSRHHMREAAEHMLECSKTAYLPEVRKQYDGVHKSMVRLTREWNALEQTREKHQQ